MTRGENMGRRIHPAETLFVSIVTPVRNGANHLEQLIHSVLRQDCSGIEFIVIDDGSNDAGATIGLLEKYPQIRWWSRPNRGQYATLNEGFAAAKGAFVTTISHDDWYLDAGAVSRIARHAEQHPDLDVIFGETVHVDQNGEALPLQPYQRFPLWMLPYTTFISHCSLFVRREKLLSLGLLFDPSLRFVGDADWLARLYRSGLRFGRIDCPIAAYRHHPAQLSNEGFRGGAEAALKVEELSRIHQRHASNPILGRIARMLVTGRRRGAIAAAAWKRGGAGAVWRSVMDWRLRNR